MSDQPTAYKGTMGGNVIYFDFRGFSLIQEKKHARFFQLVTCVFSTKMEAWLPLQLSTFCLDPLTGTSTRPRRPHRLGKCWEGLETPPCMELFWEVHFRGDSHMPNHHLQRPWLRMLCLWGVFVEAVDVIAQPLKNAIGKFSDLFFGIISYEKV